MDEKKKAKIRRQPRARVVTIPGQKSAQDTSNWDDKSFGTPNKRDLIPTFADYSKDPNYMQGRKLPKDHIGPKE